MGKREANIKQRMKWGHLRYFGAKEDQAKEVLRQSLKEIERSWEKPSTWGTKISMGEGERRSEQYLGLFSAELQPLLDWVLWDEMEKLSSQVLISDQSLRSQPTAKLLYPDRQTLAG